MQMYWPAVRLSQSPMTYGFHFMNWARVVLPPTAAARLELFLGTLSDANLLTGNTKCSTYHVSPVTTCCNLQAAGKHAALVNSQVSLFERYCKAPVPTPYLVDNASHPEPVETACPRHVVVVAGALVVGVEVVEGPKLAEVKGAATSKKSGSRTVKSGNVTLQTS